MSDDLLDDDSNPATTLDPGPYRDRPSRVPNLGHAAIFVGFAFLTLLLVQLLLLSPATLHGRVPVAIQPKRQLATMTLAYLATLGFCFVVFPLFWQRGFLAGIEWSWDRARGRLLRLAGLGLALGWTVQAISSLIPMPKEIPMDDFFRSTSDVWLVTLFGTLLAPAFEEIAFRGFLLPAVAIAFDWVGPAVRYMASFSAARLGGETPPRHIAAQSVAQSVLKTDSSRTDNLASRSVPALLAASVATSLLFAMLHADQLAHAWQALTVLFCVSLVLTAVRIRTRSVAASALVHACYNLSVFVTLFFSTGGYRHLERMTH